MLSVHAAGDAAANPPQVPALRTGITQAEFFASLPWISEADTDKEDASTSFTIKIARLATHMTFVGCRGGLPRIKAQGAATGGRRIMSARRQTWVRQMNSTQPSTTRRVGDCRWSEPL